MKKNKKMNLIFKLLIISIIVIIVFILYRQLTKTLNINYSTQQLLATDNNIEDVLCLEVEGGAVPNPCKGDINNDGYITRADVVKLQKVAAKLETLDNDLGDINNDGNITSADARLVLRLASYINDYRNYMLNETDGIDLKQMIEFLGEDYLYNCNTLFVGENITVVPNFELSGKSSISNKTITAESTDIDVATVELTDDSTKVKVTAKKAGNVQIIVKSSDDTSTVGILNLSIREKMYLIGSQTARIFRTADINGDGIVTDFDALEILLYTAGINSDYESIKDELDINNDGKVTAADARKVLRLSEYLNGDNFELDDEDKKIWGNNSKNIYNTLDVNDTITLKALDENKKDLQNVTWNARGDVLEVENGVVTAKKAGTAKITATSSDSNFSCSVTFTVKESKTDSTTRLQYTESGDENCKIVGYSGDDAYLVVPEKINNLKVTEIGDNAFDNCNSLIRVDFPESVTTVGNSIFTDCDNLSIVCCPGTSDGVGACFSDICERVGEYQKNGYDIYSYKNIDDSTCSIEVMMPWDISEKDEITLGFPREIAGYTVTTLGDGKGVVTPSLTNVTLKIPDTVTTIKSNALDSENIKEIIFLKETDTAKLNIEEDAFNENTTIFCRKNSGIYNLLKGKNYKVDDVVRVSDHKIMAKSDKVVYGYVEDGWENVKEYNYSGANGNRTEIHDLAFYNNYVVEKIDVTGWSNLKTIGDKAFMSCTNLSTLNLPNKITTIGEKAFCGCISLKKLILPTSITSIGAYAFDGMEGTVYYPSSVESVINAYKGNFSNFVEIELDSIIVKTSPTKTNYIAGENFDKNGMEIVAIYNDGSKKKVTNYNVLYGDNLLDGQSTVTISYEENGITAKVTQDIIVVQKKVNNISIQTLPAKTEYVKGETLNTKDMVVEVTYDNGLSEVVTDYTCSPEKLDKVGKVQITVTYDGKTATFDVIVKESADEIVKGDWVFQERKTHDFRVVRYMGSDSDLEIPKKKDESDELPVSSINDHTFTKDNLPEELVINSLKLPETINTIESNAFAGLTNLTELVLPDDIQRLFEESFNGLGDRVVKYKLGTTTAKTLAQYDYGNKLQVIAPKTLTILANPKTEYEKGEKLDLKNGKLIATYEAVYATNNQETTQEIPMTAEEVEVTGYNENQTGEQVLTVTYAGKSATLNITVEAKELTEIEITNPPTKTNYVAGENFNAEGMEVKAVYSDKTSKTLSDEEYSITDGEDLTIGKETVTISYTEGSVTKTTTQNITVVAKELTGIEITNPPTKTDYVAGENFNKDGMKITVSYNDGTSRTLSDEEYTVVDGNNLQEGKTTVTIRYSEGGISIDKTVNIIVLKGESILKEDSQYKVDLTDEVLYITKVMPKTSIEIFKKELVEGYDIDLYDVEGNKISNDAEYVKTNMKMIVRKDGNTVGEYILVVIGDCNGSGTTNVSDLTKLMISIAENLATDKDETKILKGAYEKAMDLNEDRMINVSDITKLCEFIANHK